MKEARDKLHPRLERFSAARRRVLNAALGYGLGTLATGAGCLGLLLLSGWLQNAFINLALYGALAIAVLSFLASYLRRRARFRTHLDEAFELEALAGDLNSRVVSALDFIEWESPSLLTRIVVAKSLKDIERDIEERIDRRERDSRQRRFLGVLAIFLLLGLSPWFSFARFGANLKATVFAVQEYFFPVVYELLPGEGKHVFLLGKKVEVGLKFEGRAYERVTLVSRTGEDVERVELPVDASGKASTVFAGEKAAEHGIHFEFGERQSPELTLIFTSRPVLENMQTEIVYPSYTRLLPRDLEGVQDRLAGLPGTRITLGFSFSKELSGATVTWDDGEELPLDVMGRFASVTFIHSESRSADLQIEDTHGYGLEYPHHLRFDLLIDERPRVYLPGHLKSEMPIMAEGLKLFSFGVRAQDDYGVVRCILKWTKSTLNDPTTVLQKGEVERLVSPPRPKAVVAFEKVFASLEASPGDKINFQVEVQDNRSPKSQKSTSPMRSFFIYQSELEDLRLAGLPGFGQGLVQRARVPKSKRALSVKAPMALRTKEKVKNEFMAKIETDTRSPRVRGDYNQAVKNYFKLMSRTTLKEE